MNKKQFPFLNVRFTSTVLADEVNVKINYDSDFLKYKNESELRKITEEYSKKVMKLMKENR